MTVEPADLSEILDLVADQRHIDLHDYKTEAVARGVESRMRTRGCDDARAYRAMLDALEIDALLQATLPTFSLFHRDAKAFHALREHVLPALAGASPRLRAWSIGTATGEEAWTTAMLLATTPGCEGYQVLGTDIDERSLAVARAGRYRSSATEELSDDLRRDFLSPMTGGWRVRDGLRAHVQFVRHDVMGHALAPIEAVVARFHLVLLRNVLIYFERRLQLEAYKRLAGIVPRGGALVLGGVERLPSRIDSFEPWPGLPSDARIFRRTESI